MKAAEIRHAFLEFYRERAHHIAPSASLVPDDPTLLLTVAGMVPFKPYFAGEKPVEHPRIASCQKCVRTNDIENVGRTARHLTLFEMLGNFSFGDYYKPDAIAWAWEFSTKVLGFEADRLWVTVFETDDEAATIWRDQVGIPEERIIRRGAEDNFWWMGVAGPGGPCSEIFYDRRPDGHRDVFDDGDQVMEFYNLVFTESEVDADGTPVGMLEKKNVDTGLGLERTAQLLQGVGSIYECDHFVPLIEMAERLSGHRYGTDERRDISVRIMAEHARASAFMIGDGILPSNEGRGYVLRRLLRRAIRHAKMLGVTEPVMSTLTDAVIGVMGEAYPELTAGRSFITQVVRGEEEGFLGTLRQGLSLLESSIADTRATGTLHGETAFKLHDTYGFPFELTVEIANEAGLEVDRATFERLMDEQRDRARAARDMAGDREDGGLKEVLASAQVGTAFTGYDHVADDGVVVGIVAGGSRAGRAGEGAEIDLVLDRTPFYAEGGGQVGDTGIIETDGARMEVIDTRRVLDSLIVHRCRVAAGEVAEGQQARAQVDAVRRLATERSHTATHILHATLREAVGDHARQAGSLVEPGRLRFDFAHFEKVPAGILAAIEETVNARLLNDDAVQPTEMSMSEARDLGAIMLFEEKYGDRVRVVDIGGYSVELCGGIHVKHTSQVGAVKLLGEASIGSNLRRIEALTGADAITGFRQSDAVLEQIATLLRSSPDDAPAKVEKLLATLKTAEQATKKQATAGTVERAKELAAEATTTGGVKVVVARTDGMGAGDLQQLALGVRDRLGTDSIVILASAADGRAQIVCAIDETLKGRGIAPATLIKEAAAAIGGGAGGRDLVATGGGKQVDGVPAALDHARAAIVAALD